MVFPIFIELLLAFIEPTKLFASISLCVGNGKAPGNLNMFMQILVTLFLFLSLLMVYSLVVTIVFSFSLCFFSVFVIDFF